jgi:hypothetical protein
MDFGSIGERQFALWCEQAGLTATQPSQDRYGWDFVVQFPHLDPAAPVDNRPAQLKCMVQVKSTSTSARRAHIKLDNWERMINDPLPWFVCAIVFGDDGSVQQLFLVHIDQLHTERVLQELRLLRASHAPGSPLLHLSNLDVHWSNEHAVLPATPSMLRDALLQHMGEDPYGYGELKRTWYRESGYEDHPRTITAHIVGATEDEIWKSLADYSLGLVEKLPIHLQQIIDHRFGIPISEHDLRGTDPAAQLGYLGPSGRSASDDHSLVISNGSRTSVTRLRCQIFHSTAITEDIPKQFRRIRVASSVLEFFVSDPQANSVGFEFVFPPLREPARAFPLADLVKLGRVLRCLTRAATDGLQVEIRNSAALGPLPLPPFEVPEGLEALCEPLELIAAAAEIAGLDPEIEMSFSSIAEQEHRLRQMWVLHREPQTIFPAKVPLAQPRDVESRRAALVGALGVTLGAQLLVSTFAICGIGQTHCEADITFVEIREGQVRMLSTELVSSEGFAVSALAARLGETRSQLRLEGFEFVSAPSTETLTRLLGVVASSSEEDGSATQN